MPHSRGFTLVELLIAIAVLIGISATLVISFVGAQATSRDTRRRSDLRQYQASSESFANRNNGLYPNYGSGTDMGALCTTLAITGPCTNDPRPPAVYRYHSSGGSGAAGSATASNYVLYATLEKRVNNQIQYWVVCSNGNVGRIPTVSWTPSGTCPGGLLQ